MANITKYLEKKLLEHSVGKSIFDKPAATYVALFTQSPTVDYTPTNKAPAVEVSGAGYARKEVQWNSAIANIDATYSSKITNADTLTINTVQVTKILKWPGTTGTINANWGTVTSIGIFDSPTVGEGNLLWFGPLSSTVTLGVGDTFTIPNTSLTLTLG